MRFLSGAVEESAAQERLGARDRPHSWSSGGRDWSHSWPRSRPGSLPAGACSSACSSACPGGQRGRLELEARDAAHVIARAPEMLLYLDEPLVHGIEAAAVAAVRRGVGEMPASAASWATVAIFSSSS